MTTQPTTRRPRPAKPEEPRTIFAPAFDRDAAALAFLADKHLISRQECRRNLQRLGVELEDEEVRRLPVPAVVRIEATYPSAPSAPESVGAVFDALDADNDEPWEPWKDVEET